MRAPTSLCLVLAVLAVSGSALAAQRAFHVHGVPGYGISLSLPSGWRTVDSKHVLSPAQLQELEQENPELAGPLSAMSRPSSPVKFFAFDPATGWASQRT